MNDSPALSECLDYPIATGGWTFLSGTVSMLSAADGAGVEDRGRMGLPRVLA
ncbi:hypothetical protein RZV17_17555 [Xanthomonas cannabis]|uniref:hypothetical protein n=1 Tax=Xanthomonas cannabis TaxID=1885674 RepID=UPI0033B93A58